MTGGTVAAAVGAVAGAAVNTRGGTGQSAVGLMTLRTGIMLLVTSRSCRINRDGACITLGTAMTVDTVHISRRISV